MIALETLDKLTTTGCPVATQAGTAVLIDYENVACLGIARVLGVMSRVRDTRCLKLARAYADWGQFAQDKLRLTNAGVELIELTGNLRGKNSADMQLAVDALELAFLHRSIANYVILTGDRDFVPLARKLRLWGKTVEIFAPEGRISELLRLTCDRVELLLIGTGQNRRKSQGDPTQNHFLEDSVLGLAAHAMVAAWHVVDAVRLETHQMGLPVDNPAIVPLSQLISMMRTLDDGFRIVDAVRSTRQTHIKLARALQAAGLITIRYHKQSNEYWACSTEHIPRFQAKRPISASIIAAAIRTAVYNRRLIEDYHGGHCFVEPFVEPKGDGCTDLAFLQPDGPSTGDD